MTPQASSVKLSNVPSEQQRTGFKRIENRAVGGESAQSKNQPIHINPVVISNTTPKFDQSNFDMKKSNPLLGSLDQKLQVINQNSKLKKSINPKNNLSAEQAVWLNKTDAYECPHFFKKQMYNNMCFNCYQIFGKQKTATKCPHVNRPHYSSGKCQSCYLAHYYQMRKER